MVPSTIAVVDRIILLSWLLKDVGWMTTNAAIAFPFGGLSALLHIFLLFYDSRLPFRLYNSSLVLWISGNFLWMTSELLAGNRSSRVHTGPRVPLGGATDKEVDNMITAHTILFLSGVAVQVLLYIGVILKVIPIPEDEEEVETIRSRNELHSAIDGLYSWCNCSRQESLTPDSEKRFDIEDNTVEINFNNIKENEIVSPTNRTTIGITGTFSTASTIASNNRISLVFLENIYIMFWLLKDVFWSGGTGDLTAGYSFSVIVLYEVLGIVSASLTLSIYVFLAILQRYDVESLLDAATTILWISANFIWMCGEFFIRYNNMKYNDDSQHDDSVPRAIAVFLFSVGITLQLYIIMNELKRYLHGRRITRFDEAEDYDQDDEINFLNNINKRWEKLAVSESPQSSATIESKKSIVEMTSLKMLTPTMQLLPFTAISAVDTRAADVTNPMAAFTIESLEEDNEI